MTPVIHQNSPILLGGMNAAYRALLQKALQDLGFKKVQSASEMQIVVNRLEADSYDWLIMGVEWKEEINALALLEMLNLYESLAKTKVSLMVAETDLPFLTRAFELGLMSYHPMISTGDQVANEIKNLVQLLSELDHDYRLVSATYLKRHLTEQGYTKDLLKFGERLASIYPSHTHVLLELADIYIQSNQHNRALSILNQINLIDPLSSIKTEPLIEQTIVFENGQVRVPDIKPFPSFKAALVVSQDTVEIDQMMVQLTEFYITSELFDPRIDFNKQCTGKQVVIIDWQQEDNSPTSFIEKLLEGPNRHIPILVLLPEGVTLERELWTFMGISEVICKPFAQNKLAKSLTALTHQALQQHELLNYLFHLSFTMRMKQAQLAKSDYMNKAPLTDGKRLEVEAILALLNNEVARARDFCYKALSVASDAPFVLALLGRALEATRDFSGAHAAFSEARIPKIETLVDALKYVKNIPPVLPFLASIYRARARTLIRSEQFMDGFSAYFELLHWLSLAAPSLYSEIAAELGEEAAQRQYLRIAKASYSKVASLQTDEIKRADAEKKALALEELIHKSQEYKVPREPKVDPHRDLTKMIKRGTAMDSRDTCCRFIYKNTENKTATEFLTKTPIKFRERTIWPGPQAQVKVS